jgi:hypothetical protein
MKSKALGALAPDPGQGSKAVDQILQNGRKKGHSEVSFDE